MSLPISDVSSSRPAIPVQQAVPAQRDQPSREVKDSVDRIISPSATPEQREQAYAAVQEYVDEVGGVGDAGIVEEYLPQKAAEILQGKNVPTVAKPEVIAAVDAQISPNATAQQRADAYKLAQAQVDKIGGVGDAGVVKEHLPLYVGQVLRDNGVLAKYQQEVVDTVDALLPPGASPAQRERAYSTVQNYVNQVGGIGDAGIVQAYLPERAAELLQEQKITLADTPFGTDAYKNLSSEQKALVREAFQTANASKGVTTAERDFNTKLKSLIENKDFNGLSATDKTAVLSQVRNYPDARSVYNLERLVAKDWFKNFGLEDKQRTLKSIAFLAQNDKGDQEINRNTLERVLSPSSTYVFAWDSSFDGDINSTGGLYGTADGTNITFNSNMVNAGNGRLTETYNSKHVVLHTIAHEVNHNVNGDKVSNTFGYLQQEYRAWFVGFKSEFGRAPTNAEAMERWRNQINGGYSARSQAAINSSAAEARKFADYLSQMTGTPAPDAKASHADLKKYIQDQVNLAVSKYANANGAAPVPPGNLTNK